MLVTINQPEHKTIRQPAQAVALPIHEQHKQFALFLKEQMLHLNGVGLAATQLGYPYQIIAFHIPEAANAVRKIKHPAVSPTILFNPSYEPIGSTKQLDWEGCFSVPDLMGEVPRFSAITYQGISLAGEPITGEAHDLLARIIQHEIGHLNGELYIDLVTPDCRFGPVDEMRQIRLKELTHDQ